MRVQNIMSHEVITVAPTSTIAEAGEVLRTNGIHHLVVADKRRVVGVLSDRDLATAAPEQPVSAVMSREVATIEPVETIKHAAALLTGHAVDCLPVVEEGALCGIITTADVLHALAKGAVHLAPPSERITLRKRSPKIRPLYE